MWVYLIRWEFSWLGGSVEVGLYSLLCHFLMLTHLSDCLLIAYQCANWYLLADWCLLTISNTLTQHVFCLLRYLEQYISSSSSSQSTSFSHQCLYQCLCSLLPLTIRWPADTSIKFLQFLLTVGKYGTLRCSCPHIYWCRIWSIRGRGLDSGTDLRFRPTDWTPHFGRIQYYYPNWV